MRTHRSSHARVHDDFLRNFCRLPSHKTAAAADDDDDDDADDADAADEADAGANAGAATFDGTDGTAAVDGITDADVGTTELGGDQEEEEEEEEDDEDEDAASTTCELRDVSCKPAPRSTSALSSHDAECVCSRRR
jgi:hypothetical protein